jgi:hypothetical protein
VDAAKRIGWVIACAFAMLGAEGRDAAAESAERKPPVTLVHAALAAVESTMLPAVPDRGEWIRATVREPEARPGGLTPLYVSLATLQALDAHSTLAGIDAGRREANPIVAPLTRDPALLIGTKTAVAAGTIVLSERIWRRHRTAAVVLLIAVNAAHALAVAHNYRKLRR